MYKTLCKINDFLYFVTKKLIMILLPVMSVLVFSQVIARFLGIPLAWSEELSTFCFSWLTYFGAAVVFRNGEHVAVMSAVDAIKNDKIQKFIIVLGNVFVLIFLWWAAYLSSTLVAQFYRNDLRSINIEFLKMSYVFLQVPVSYFIFGSFTLEKIISILYVPKEDTVAVPLVQEKEGV